MSGPVSGLLGGLLGSRAALVAVLLAAACAAALWAHRWHERAVQQAVHTAVLAELDAIEAKTDAELASLQREVLARETRAAVAALNLEVLDHELKRKAAADAARARSERERLQHALSQQPAVLGGQGAHGTHAAPTSSADGAPAVAIALSECSARYEQVAGVADQLAIQVIGLQRFVVEVLEVAQVDVVDVVAEVPDQR